MQRAVRRRHPLSSSATRRCRATTTRRPTPASTTRCSRSILMIPRRPDQPLLQRVDARPVDGRVQRHLPVVLGTRSQLRRDPRQRERRPARVPAEGRERSVDVPPAGYCASTARGSSLLGDLLDQMFAKYGSRVTTPLDLAGDGRSRPARRGSHALQRGRARRRPSIRTPTPSRCTSRTRRRCRSRARAVPATSSTRASRSRRWRCRPAARRRCRCRAAPAAAAAAPAGRAAPAARAARPDGRHDRRRRHDRHRRDDRHRRHRRRHD